MILIDIKERLLQSKLFKDSFWAVFGNGLGNVMMLFAGILIARFLGKDLYGEYGIVKTTMFYIASFATFGLGFTATRYIADFVKNNPSHLKSAVRSALIITLSFSCVIAALLIIFAPLIANYLEEEGLTLALRTLAGVIVFKAITTTQIGLLAGFKDFKHIAYNSLASGIFMLILSVPFTYYFGLKGAFASLLFSQMFNAFVNYFSIKKFTSKLENQNSQSYTREMIRFSFPVALQESSFTICHWAAIMLLTKYSSMGELGLYTASAQWNSIILMIPTLLSNVVLSYLSSAASNINQYHRTIKKMVLINFICTFIPFVGVYVMAGFISSFYGTTFSAMPVVLRVCTFSTILESVASVLKSDLLARGKPWLLFSLRCFRDVLLVVSVYFFLNNNHGLNGAVIYSWVGVGVGFVFLFSLIAIYLPSILVKQKL